MSDQSNLLRSIFNALPESAPGGVDVSKWYVNRASDDENDPVANLHQCIYWEEEPDPGRCYLFSGLRGSGKTTELNRLVKELRANNIAAYYCDASAYLNLNDPQLSLAELLMTALAGLADAVRKEIGKDHFSDSIWQRTKRLLGSNVELNPKLKLGGAGTSVEIEATLQENPDFRKHLIQFAQSSSDFYDEAVKFSEEIAKTIRQHTRCKKIVLIVDSLERISAPSGDEVKLFDSLKEIFHNAPGTLHFPSLSVVYSVPPYLEAVLPSVNKDFSMPVVSLPNFKVIQPVDGAPKNQEGIDKMVEILDRRHPAWPQVMARSVVEYLAWMSGGNVRRFFSLMRTVARKAALSRAELPINDPNDPPIRHAISEAAQPLQWLTARDRQWLKHFMASNRNPSEHIQNQAEDLPSIIRLFDHSLVLDYRNGSVWYQVPQIVREYVVD